VDKLAILDQYLPPGAVSTIAYWIEMHQCQFKISRNRATKLGDYKSPCNGINHRISINSTLNPYAFLITTIHEFAHLITWNEHKNNTKPHGLVWKRNFKKLMYIIMENVVFPDDIQNALYHHLENPSASSCTDLNLMRVLQRYDDNSDGFIKVEELALNSVFTTPNGRIFRKKNLIRKRYCCVEIATGRQYLFSPIAKIKQAIV